MFTSHKLGTDGDYYIKSRVYGLVPEDAEPVKAALVIDGKEVAYDCLGGVEAGDRSYVESEERTVVLGAIAQARKHLNERIEE